LFIKSGQSVFFSNFRQLSLLASTLNQKLSAVKIVEQLAGKTRHYSEKMPQEEESGPSILQEIALYIMIKEIIIILKKEKKKPIEKG
jgi:hypothetical protein